MHSTIINRNCRTPKGSHINMFHKREVFILLSAILLLVPSTSMADKFKEVNTTVYFFGIARNYTDSIACITEIYPINNVTIYEKTKAVLNIELYTQQLYTFFNQQGKYGYICTTFTSPKYKKIEKLYLKLKKRLNADPGASLQFIPNAAFHYQLVDSKTIYRNNPSEETEEKTSENSPSEENTNQ